MNKIIKKNWKKVSLHQMDDKWQVLIDGRSIKSPKGIILNLHFDLAKEIFKEWDKIEDKVSPSEMPFFSFVVTTFDRVKPQKEFVINQLISIFNKDLICYWEDTNNDLKNMHIEEWKPLIKWFEDKLKIKLVVTEGIIPANQKELSLMKVKKLLKQFDEFYISSLYALTSVSGSLVLPLALFYEEITLKEFYKKSLLDELYQSKRWGEDKDASQRRENIFYQFKQATDFIKLVKKINS